MKVPEATTAAPIPTTGNAANPPIPAATPAIIPPTAPIPNPVFVPL